MTDLHDDFAHRLADAADDDGRLGALPPELARHEAECAECRGLLEALRLLARDGDATFADVPSGYWDEFEVRLRGKLSARRRARPIRLLAAAAAVLAAAVAVVLAVRTGGTDPAGGAGGALVAAEASDPVTVLSSAGADDVEVALASLASSQGETWLAEDTGTEDDAALDGEGDAEAGTASVDEAIATEATGFGAEVPGDVLGLLEDDIASGLDEDAQRELARRIEEALRS
jgi:hypothetical protein